jgi:hypothetical protein
MMKYCGIALSVISVASIAVAGGLELSKDAVSVSPPDPQGNVAITGPPGCIVGLPPIYIMARNKKTGAVVNASALPNGSFILQIPAGGRDTVKLTFVSANGKTKDMTVKVPGIAYEPRGEDRKGKRAEVNVDLSQFAVFGAPEVVQVKPDAEWRTTVHVGPRPTQTPVPTPSGTAGPSFTPSPELGETPPATSSTEIQHGATPADETPSESP